MKFLDQIPDGVLVVIAILMLLAPFRPMPHVIEKLIMLKNGSLAQPVAPRWHWTLTLQAPNGWRLDGAVQASDIGNAAID